MREKGVALLMALLVVALATSVAGYIAWQSNTWVSQLQSQEAQAQANQLARGGLQFARYILKIDNPQVDSLGENWAQQLPVMPVDGGTLAGRIEDAQSRFNLNNMVQDGKASEADIAIFRRLLQLLQLPPQLADAVVDWMDVDQETRVPGGAEDNVYLAQSPPYRTAGQPLATIDELVHIKGFDEAMVKRLQPYVTALPGRTTINVNTAPDIVLAAVFDGMGLSQAETIVNARPQLVFTGKSDFLAHLPASVGQLHDADFDVHSSYFLAGDRVQIGRSQVNLRALLFRSGPGLPAIVWMRREED